jgi:Family of unknown function (DUF6527)
VKQHALSHEFIEHFPEQLAEGTLYVSMQYATAAHKCCCGCGNDVYTPLSPTDWELIFDGRTISLHPSIGNWSFLCQSHYFITSDRVQWVRRWSSQEIAAGRASDKRAKQQCHDAAKTTTTDRDEERMREKPAKRWWRKLTMWF